MAQRYYWLRLQKDFFASRRIKKMRRLEGGDTNVVIYLKMQLLAMQHDGVIEYAGLEDSIAEEIALDIDEDVDAVQRVLGYLMQYGLAEDDSNGDGGILLPFVVDNIGSETGDARRKRSERRQTAEQPEQASAPEGDGKAERSTGKEEHRIARARRGEEQHDEAEQRDGDALLGDAGAAVQDTARTNDGQNADNVRTLSKKPRTNRGNIPGEKEIEKEKEIDKKDISAPAAPVRTSKAELEDEFARLWAMLPKKRGDKRKAFAAYAKARKEGTTMADVMIGINSYKAAITVEETPDEYIMQAATFFLQRRWLDDWSPHRPRDRNQFNRMEQHDYDFDELEAELLGTGGGQ